MDTDVNSEVVDSGGEADAADASADVVSPDGEDAADEEVSAGDVPEQGDTVEDATVEGDTVEDATVEGDTVEDDTVEDDTTQDVQEQDVPEQDIAVDDIAVDDVAVDDVAVDDVAVDDIAVDDATDGADTGGEPDTGDGADAIGVDAVAGPTACEEITTISCGSATSLVMPGRASEFDGAACGVTGGAVGASGERVFRLAVAESGAVHLSQDTGELGLSVLSGDCNADASCRGAGGKVVSLPVTGGEELLVVVDGYGEPVEPGGTAGLESTLTVTCCGACVPGACGYDECGQFCTCGDGEVCVAGSCAPPGSGESCETAHFISGDALPVYVPGSTTEGGDGFNFASAACGGGLGSGQAAPDHVYVFTAPEPALYGVSIDGNFAAALYALRGEVNACTTDPLACVASSSTGDELLSVTLVAGESLTLVVDGQSPGAAGEFTLVISPICNLTCSPGTCGSPDGCGGVCGCTVGAKCVADACVPLAVGDSCEDPIVIDSASLPAYVEGDTSSAINRAALTAPCGDVDTGGAGSADLVIRFTAPVAANYPIDFQGFDGLIIAHDACADVTGSCLQAVDAIGDVETMSLALAQGQTIYLTVDGYSNLSAVGGPFLLTVGAPCTPSCSGTAGAGCGFDSDGCGGDCACATGLICDTNATCAVPAAGDGCASALTLAGPLPITFSGTTTGAFHDDGGICSGALDLSGSVLGHGAPDVVLRYVPIVTGTYVFTLDNAFLNDPSLLSVVSDCAQPQSSCLAAADLYDTENGSLSVALTAGVPTFILVDGYATSGTFALRLDLEP